MLDGKDIVFPPDLAGELMASPEAVEAQERNLLDALRRAAHLVRDGAGFVLTDARGSAMIHFEQAPDQIFPAQVVAPLRRQVRATLCELRAA